MVEFKWKVSDEKSLELLWSRSKQAVDCKALCSGLAMNLIERF